MIIILNNIEIQTVLISDETLLHLKSEVIFYKCAKFNEEDDGMCYAI